MKTFINFILDRSASMASVRQATVDGFNEFLREQKKIEEDAWMSLTLFDTEFEVRYVALELKNFPEMTLSKENPYITTGQTALYDAVVTTIRGTENWLLNNSWFDGEVVSVILTDGEENCSRQFEISDVNALIEQKQKDGWKFIFLGSGESGWLEAQKFSSISPKDRFAFGHDDNSTRASYRTACDSVSATRDASSSHTIGMNVISFAKAVKQRLGL